MTVVSNKGIFLKAIPQGMPKVDDFELVDRIIDIEKLDLGENDIVLKNVYFSLDPYTRIIKLNNSSSVGQIVTGFGLSEVVKTNNSKYKVGDLVYATVGILGWEEYSHIKSDATFTFKHVNKEILKVTQLSHHVSLFNLGGLTAYPPLITIGNPKKGETIFVSTAAGSIGQIVGQIAKIKGLRVVGSTGSDEKVDFLLNELKFDAAFNYKKVDYDKALSKYCPNGVDIYFDNVGGEALDTVLNHCNQFARVIICGIISQYNARPEEKYGIKNLDKVLFKSIHMEGFSAPQYYGTEIEKEFEREMTEWIKTGKIIYKENISIGIESIPKAFIDMLKGNSVGKALVKLSDY